MSATPNKTMSYRRDRRRATPRNSPQDRPRRAKKRAPRADSPVNPLPSARKRALRRPTFPHHRRLPSNRVRSARSRLSPVGCPCQKKGPETLESQAPAARTVPSRRRYLGDARQEEAIGPAHRPSRQPDDLAPGHGRQLPQCAAASSAPGPRAAGKRDPPRVPADRSGPSDGVSVVPLSLIHI